MVADKIRKKIKEADPQYQKPGYFLHWAWRKDEGVPWNYEIYPNCFARMSGKQGVGEMVVLPNVKGNRKLTEWIMNESIWAPAFITKNYNTLHREGGIIDCSQDASVVIGGCTALRQVTENPNFKHWWRYLREGFTPEEAYVICSATEYLKGNPRDTKSYYSKGGYNNHCPVGGWTKKGLAMFLNKKRLEITKPFNFLCQYSLHKTFSGAKESYTSQNWLVEKVGIKSRYGFETKPRTYKETVVLFRDVFKEARNA